MQSTVRLKYDDTDFDQKFSESRLNPLIAWKTQLYAHQTPTKGLLNAWKRLISAWKRLRNANAKRGVVHFQRIPGHHI